MYLGECNNNEPKNIQKKNTYVLALINQIYIFWA